MGCQSPWRLWFAVWIPAMVLEITRLYKRAAQGVRCGV
jgi:hypothetical protein